MLPIASFWSDSVGEPLTRVFENLVTYLPNLFAAIALVIVGLVAAFLFRALTRRLVAFALRRLKRDTRVSDEVQKHWYYQSLPSLISGVVFWIVLLFFVSAGVEALGLDALSSLFGSLTVYLPRVLAVALIIFAGILLGDMAHGWVDRVAERSGIAASGMLGRAVQVAIWLVAVLMSIDQLGISSDVIIVAIAIGGGSLAGAGALAFGLGARNAVSNIIAAHYVQHSYRVGDTVKIGQLKGKITGISRIAVVLETPDGQATVPAKRFNEEVSVLFEEDD